MADALDRSWMDDLFDYDNHSGAYGAPPLQEMPVPRQRLGPPPPMADEAAAEAQAPPVPAPWHQQGRNQQIGSDQTPMSSLAEGCGAAAPAAAAAAAAAGYSSYSESSGSDSDNGLAPRAGTPSDAAAAAPGYSAAAAAPPTLGGHPERADAPTAAYLALFPEQSTFDQAAVFTAPTIGDHVKVWSGEHWFWGLVDNTNAAADVAQWVDAIVASDPQLCPQGPDRPEFALMIRLPFRDDAVRTTKILRTYPDRNKTVILYDPNRNEYEGGAVHAATQPRKKKRKGPPVDLPSPSPSPTAAPPASSNSKNKSNSNSKNKSKLESDEVYMGYWNNGKRDKDPSAARPWPCRIFLDADQGGEWVKKTVGGVECYEVVFFSGDEKPDKQLLLGEIVCGGVYRLTTESAKGWKFNVRGSDDTATMLKRAMIAAAEAAGIDLPDEPDEPDAPEPEPDAPEPVVPLASGGGGPDPSEEARIRPRKNYSPEETKLIRKVMREVQDKKMRWADALEDPRFGLLKEHCLQNGRSVVHLKAKAGGLRFEDRQAAAQEAAKQAAAQEAARGEKPGPIFSFWNEDEVKLLRKGMKKHGAVRKVLDDPNFARLKIRGQGAVSQKWFTLKTADAPVPVSVPVQAKRIFCATCASNGASRERHAAGCPRRLAGGTKPAETRAPEPDEEETARRARAGATLRQIRTAYKKAVQVSELYREPAASLRGKPLRELYDRLYAEHKFLPFNFWNLPQWKDTLREEAEVWQKRLDEMRDSSDDEAEDEDEDEDEEVGGGDVDARGVSDKTGVGDKTGATQTVVCQQCQSKGRAHQAHARGCPKGKGGLRRASGAAAAAASSATKKRAASRAAEEEPAAAGPAAAPSPTRATDRAAADESAAAGSKKRPAPSCLPRAEKAARTTKPKTTEDLEKWNSLVSKQYGHIHDLTARMVVASADAVLESQKIEMAGLQKRLTAYVARRDLIQDELMEDY